MSAKEVAAGQAAKWGIIVGGGLLVGWYLFGQAKKATVAAAAAAGKAVDVTSDTNLVYKGINKVGDVLDDGTKDDSFTLGGWLYDITHPAITKQTIGK